MITKIHESVFPLPIREDAVRRQIVDMGERYIGAKKARPMPEMTRDAFLMRQSRRQREVTRGVK